MCISHTQTINFTISGNWHIMFLLLMPHIICGGMEFALKERKKTIHNLSTTQLIALGFLAAIAAGTILLMLPVSSADRHMTPFIDSLFTATTSVCVTGLVTLNTSTHWSLFGKIVILILIQLGGLGIVSFSTGIMVIFGKRITLKDRMLLEDALNLDTLKGLVKFLKKIFKGTFIIEGIGALCYAPVFIKEYDFLKGTGFAIFHSVSAFCNAGIDLLGDNSLVKYVSNPWMNFVTMFLIVMGGLGFIVWWDVQENFINVIHKHLTFTKALQKLRLHSKITLIATASLIFGGMILILLLEFTNDGTIGNMSFGNKLMASLFQSVTLRTAGFMTFPQSSLRGTTVIICLFLMFIGGSSIGTAGGIKTSTFALLFLSTRATIKGSKHLVVFNKTIPYRIIHKALAVTFVSFSVLIAAVFALHLTEGGSLLDCTYEATSAIATVGLSRDMTGTLHLAGKVIIIICMYLGRIGPISMAIFFTNGQKKQLLSYPHEDVTVG